MNTKSNIKTIARNTVSIPAELGATGVEVVADATTLLSGAVRGAIPTAKLLANIVGKFATGMAMSDAKPEQVVEIYNNTTLSDVLNMIDMGAVKAGQSAIKLLDEDDTNNVDLTKLTKAQLIAKLQA